MQGKEDLLNVNTGFNDNYHLYKAVTKENIECMENNSGYTEIFFFDMAAFKMVQDNCVNILKKVLKELLCEASDDKIEPSKRNNQKNA